MWLRGMRKLFAAHAKALLDSVSSKTFVQGHGLACFALSPFRLARGLPETSSKHCNMDGLFLRQCLLPLDDCDSFGHT
jgi:hypothetical protein